MPEWLRFTQAIFDALCGRVILLLIYSRRHSGILDRFLASVAPSSASAMARGKSTMETAP